MLAWSCRACQACALTREFVAWTVPNVCLPITPLEIFHFYVMLVGWYFLTLNFVVADSSRLKEARNAAAKGQGRSVVAGGMKAAKSEFNKCVFNVPSEHRGVVRRHTPAWRGPSRKSAAKPT